MEQCREPAQRWGGYHLDYPLHVTSGSRMLAQIALDTRSSRSRYAVSWLLTCESGSASIMWNIFLEAKFTMSCASRMTVRTTSSSVVSIPHDRPPGPQYDRIDSPAAYVLAKSRRHLPRLIAVGSANPNYADGRHKQLTKGSSSCDVHVHTP